jgi:hypothetical protein
MDFIVGFDVPRGVNEPSLEEFCLFKLGSLNFYSRPKFEPSSRLSPKTVFEFGSYINRAEPEPAHDALNKI